MKITNKFGLSRVIVDAVNAYVSEYDLYESPDNIVSVTELIDAPRSRILAKRYREKIVKDVTDYTWMFLGSASHSRVEHLASKGNPESERLSEERWFYDLVSKKVYTVDSKVDFWKTKDYSPDAFYVSGKFDCYDGIDGIVEDHKVTSVWTVVYSDGGGKVEWDRQLNCYAFAIRLLGFPVNAVRVNAIFRDFQQTKAGDANYPKASQACIPANLWTQDEAEEYITKRARLHFNSRKLSDKELDLCSPDERWSKPTTYAVKKEGRKTAVRVLDDEETAVSLAKELGKGHSVETRPGKNTRCESYCDAKQFCSFGKNL